MAVRSHSSWRVLLCSHILAPKILKVLHAVSYLHWVLRGKSQVDKSQAIYFQAQNCCILVPVLNGTLLCQCRQKAQNADLRSSDFKIIEHTEWRKREAHKGHAGSKGRGQGLTEHGSCRRGTVSPSIHPLAHTGVIQVTAAVTHAGTGFKVNPALKSITTWETRVFLSLPSLNFWTQLVTDPSYISLQPRIVCTLTLYLEVF